MRWIAKLMLVCVAGWMALPVLAQNSKQPWEEYDKLIKAKGEVSALGPTLFGDDVSLYSGGLSFTATDVSLPGNSKLPVAITRKFTVANHKGYQSDAMMADWDLDVPYIAGTYAPDWVVNTTTPNNRCSVTNAGAARPPNLQSGSKTYLPEDYWHGLTANMPGGGQMMLAKAGVSKPSTGTYYWVTSGWTYFSCLSSIKNGTGEGFQAITADGTKYTFDFMAGYIEPMFKGAKPGDPDIPRSRRVLYATRVEDRFGNWVNYTYANTAYNQPARLTAIAANDGRQITLQYDGYGHVSSISDGTHTWTYQYVYPSGSQQSLSAVVLPDNSRWSMDFAALFRAAVRYYKGQPGDPYRDCVNPGDPEDYTPVVGTITHPSGAVGQFSVAVTRFGRSNVPMLCSGVTTPTNDPNDDVSYYPMQWDSFALTSKQVSGPGLTVATWTYSYASDRSFAPGTPACSNGICPPTCSSDACAGKTTVVVTGPNSTWTRHTFGNSYRYNEGKLLKVEQGSSATDILRTDAMAYELAQSGQAFPTPVGTEPQPRSDGFDAEYLRPLRSKAITQQGVTGTYTVNTFDSYASPASVARSNGTYSRTDSTLYAHDLSKWVLSQVASTTSVNTGAVVAQTDYNAAMLPWKIYGFGKLQYTLAYNADGTLATATDGRGNTTTLSGWKRGIPQSIRYPATPEAPSGAVETASVNDDATIASITDEIGAKTCYAYDPMGRIASITRPSEAQAGVCDAATWAPTTQSFQQIATTEYGVPANHWKQTISTGNGRKVVYFDAFWRPVVEESYDVANATQTRSVSVTRYDASGHPIFQSYPRSSLVGYLDAGLTGTRTAYDALDRVTSIKQDSELGLLTTSTEYLAGLKTRVTNPRGFATTTSYMAYDQPSTDWPVAITQPEGALTDITRDVFGKPTSLVRHNASNSQRVTRNYVYNGNQELCKAIEPETGTTFYGYDAAGNLSWTAAGLNFPSTSACEYESAFYQGRSVVRAYDSRNRVSSLTFPDGRGNQSWQYTPDGLPSQITTYNDPNNGAPVVNAYTYNKRRLLTGESAGQTGWYTWGIGYSYDGNGALQGQSYPTGLYVDYAPNGLGQATKAGTYATGVSYYPNGGIKQFTYGNGIVHTMTQNERQLPARSSDLGGGNTPLDFRYIYDANANVTIIPDDALGGSIYSRWMQYDGLDRLIEAKSCHFGGDCLHRFTYDALDNLKSWKLAGVKDYANYYYDASNRLTNIQNSSGASILGLGYDVQGNLQNKNGQAYEFDYGNRLRNVPGKEGLYRYDGLGRRVMLWRPNNTVTLSQYSHAGQVLYQENGTSALAIENIYLAGSLVASRERNWMTNVSTTKYQHTDALGSPVAVSNQAAQVIERTQWEPYGAAINKAVDGVGYTGHVMDTATGLTYMQQRYYDPSIGRFLSTDPVAAGGNNGINFNRYWYAANSPYRFTDPDGRRDWDSLSAHSSNLTGAGFGFRIGPPPVMEGSGISFRKETAATPAKADNRSFMLPQNDEESGFYNYGTPPNGGGQYGKGATLSAIFAAGHEWLMQGNENNFGVGNISLKNGEPFPPHQSHRNGLDVDIRPMNSKGLRIAGVTWRSPIYDRVATQNLVNAFYATGRVRQIFFNDPELVGVKPLPGHDDHLHVQVVP